jgi:hypothetical protein
MNVTTELGIPLVFRNLTKTEALVLAHDWQRCNHEIIDSDGEVLVTHTVAK